MKKVLVVVDMQNDFIDGALGTKEAAGIVENVVSKIKNFKGFESKIFVTLDSHYHDYMDTSEGEKLPIPHCIRMTQGWLPHEKVIAALDGKNYEIIEKPTFGSTRLITEVKRNKGGDDIEIEIIGLRTDICVVSNALLLKAYFPETKITVDASCCAGATPEAHEAALRTMESCQIEVIGG